ncbi:UDP-N-acetylmuramate:L-alanyl-gamma-D-glutamyl-meso-diaminopimelate ligase [Alkalilimnicola sp. S0819]|uniref:UDP-N-acetylmuramate:L-alanyl-gamma-D-glutamyl- meso-diaminopimelate ligase n=1 Tax=Alkalilimnicola sp. S0819 TaxID=2613922 RepID=UPI0012629015|nr:UDP-N-acetylmuramate:L-alanyl-gamma-D-glutamyl-meso-diaminopimelate ligase [Alkalilimnicola sp. S0819]KAB7623021.1 UDP-N-acetylmuramate:L-alanyl-gamma-D-glutamyl-meso-diaminopimelate ligase [Alkalilimnicola sp. S0819]MPQ17133.1 UDP-N-acetylmuramate:L-alanyl-gamma-D-glutamyl-meso-diaminopimelate ligase [Alkalilimnicola sp. S0819]
MHIHILGICGTFMGGIALLAREAGHTVSGSDVNVYPPMSDMLAAHGIRIHQGYDPGQLEPAPDCVVIGNALSRGNPAVEAVLERGLPYRSGPQWLAENILRDKWVLAVSGTHGKTTTASVLAWLLEAAGLAPGFLIGGVPANFGLSARLGETDFFVIEADEYDSAFFDKRSKFVHFGPRTLLVNNLEFDHADIFPDLAAIQRQFHHLVRTVPGGGRLIVNGDQPAVAEMLAMGCWTPVERFGSGTDNDWRLAGLSADQREFTLLGENAAPQSARWALGGEHNARNALGAMLAARHVGVPLAQSAQALADFRGIKRRLELRGEAGGVRVIDDFAHHPTAIAATLEALRAQTGEGRILAVTEPRSNTMRLGKHRHQLAPALRGADLSFVLQSPGLAWRVEEALAPLSERARSAESIDELVAAVLAEARPGDQILVMSNGGFGGIHSKLLDGLASDGH